MEQLLKIVTVPIEYELKINNARLERKSGTAELEISRNKGGLSIHSRPVRINIDTFEARNSVVPTTRRSIAQFADKGKQAAYEATAQFAKEGQMLLKAKIGEGAETLNRLLRERIAPATGEFQLGFIPTTGAELSATDPSLTINYEMDKLNFDWKISQGSVEFIPGDIEMTITQYPDVRIEYMGDPIYVPPSAAARFTGETLDVMA